MKNQKLISRNVIRKFSNGDKIFNRGAFKYLDLGENKFTLLYELPAPGRLNSIEHEGKKYYYNPRKYLLYRQSKQTTQSSNSNANNSNNYPRIVDRKLYIGENKVIPYPLYSTIKNPSKKSITLQNGITYYYNPNHALLVRDNNATSTGNSNISLNNTKTSGNIWSLQRSDGSVKNFRDSVIDYQNSHSTDNDIKFTIPSGNVPIIENDSLIRETNPDVETMMSENIFTNLRGSVKRNPTLLTTSSSIEHRLPSNSTEYRLPESLAEYRSKNQVLSSNTTTPEQKEEVQTTLTNPVNKLNIDNLREEIKIYFRNGNPIETVKSESDIDKWDDDTVMRVFEQIEHIYNDSELSLKISYAPPKETKKESSTSPFATTPSSVDLNRADVRAIMSHYGLDTTPSLRKAFRKYLGGDRNQDISFIDLNSNLHKDWIAPFVVYKNKNGGLISKNSIERFLKGKAIKKALKVIYNTLANSIHTIFGNPGNQKAPNISNYGGGRFGGAGYSGYWKNPIYSYNEIYPADTLLVPATQTFNDAFADARRRGLDTFEFNGGIYGTELGDNPNWKTAGDARTRDAVIPVPIPADTIRRTSDVPRNDTIITNVGYRRYPVSTSNINRIFNK